MASCKHLLKPFTRSVCRRDFPRRAQSRRASTVSDADIARLAEQPLHPLTLRDLVRYGHPPLSPAALYQSANFALSVLPPRLAHRIRSLRDLPFIVVANPNVSQILGNYMHSLSTLLPMAERGITTVEAEDHFTELMAGIVQTHASTIPVLARGFLESRKYISPEAVTTFLDEHLRARIGTRLIAEQHIALHNSSQPHTGGPGDSSTSIGVIDTEMQPAKIVRSCESFVADICELRYGVRPRCAVNGEPGASIAHVPMHLEYILTELLKNAFRATIEQGHEKEPVEVTIAPAPADSLQSTEGINTLDQGEPRAASPRIKPLEQATPGVTIRIRDRGGGISPEHLADIWKYSFTTFDEDQIASATGGGGGGAVDALNVISATGVDSSSLAGLGYGLPLGRAYAEYFGGGIAVQSLYGWGTDVYLSLRGVGKID